MNAGTLALAFLLSVLTVLTVLSAAFMVLIALDHILERLERRDQIRAEVREAERILALCIELDLDVDQLLELESLEVHPRGRLELGPGIPRER